jgi:hypothetical protein
VSCENAESTFIPEHDETNQIEYLLKTFKIKLLFFNLGISTQFSFEKK